ncbi:MAG TPA: ComEC/Rec2 family competence protein [Candidatus Paceibacterota bacterium]|jgi:competence protein ComEC
MQRIGFYLAIGGFTLGVAYASAYTFLPVAAVGVSLLCGIFLIGYVVVRRPAYVLVLVSLGAFLTGGFRMALTPTALPSAFVPLLDTRTVLEGVIVRQPDVRESATRLTVEVEREREKTYVLAVAPPHGNYYVGDKVAVGGTLARPEPFETDGGRTFAYDAFLAKDGVFALIEPARVEITGKESGISLLIMRQLQVLRERFVRALERSIPEPQSALAAGLITGGKQGLGKELLNVFTIAGLIHIVVLSGYNVMIVAEAVVAALGFLPRRTALLAAGVTIALFVIAAGAGAAALRAGAMALLGLMARATGKTYAVLRALFLTFALMLLWNPLLLLNDPGFQFSFIATVGLIVGAPRLERMLTNVRPKPLRDIAASTLAAQVAVLPILLFHTGNLSLVAFAANLAVLPVIPFAMAASGGAALFALLLPQVLEPLVLLMGLPANALLMYVIEAARLAAGLPFAQVLVPIFPLWVLAAAYALLVAVLMKTKGTEAPAPAPTYIRPV